MSDNPILKFVTKSLLTAITAVFLLSARGMAFGGHQEIDYSLNASNMYYCASTGTVLTQAGVSISSPALSLYNPMTSQKNLILIDVGIDVMSSPAAAAAFSLAYNITPSSGIAGGVAGNTTSAIVGKSTSTATTTALATCWAQGILPATPIAFRYLGGTTGASAIGGVKFIDETNGKVVIPPGGLVSFQASSATNVQLHYLWREDPL